MGQIGLAFFKLGGFEQLRCLILAASRAAQEQNCNGASQQSVHNGDPLGDRSDARRCQYVPYLHPFPARWQRRNHTITSQTLPGCHIVET